MKDLMRVLKWILNNKMKLIFLIVILFFLPLMIIHVLFFYNANTPFFTAQWTAGDMMIYYVTFMAAAGTIFLGLVALYQTEKIRVDAIEKAKPDIQIKEIFGSPECRPNGETKYKIDINIVNLSLNEAKNIFIKNASLFNYPSTEGVEVVFSDSLASLLCTVGGISSDYSYNTENGCRIEFDLYYCNRDNYVYRRHVNALCKKSSNSYWSITSDEYIDK